MTRISPNTTPGYLHFYLKEDGGESFCDLIRQFFLVAAEKRQSCKKFYNFAVIGDVLIWKHFITVPIFGLWDIYNLWICFFKDGPFLASFSLFLSFLFKCTIGRSNFANVGIWTADLWSLKQKLYQLSHHQCHLYLLKMNISSLGCSNPSVVCLTNILLWFSTHRSEVLPFSSTSILLRRSMLTSFWSVENGCKILVEDATEGWEQPKWEMFISAVCFDWTGLACWIGTQCHNLRGREWN